MQSWKVVAVLAGFAAATMLAVGCGSGSTRAALDRATSSDDPARFEFVDRPDAASLMECLGAAETLAVTVDTERNTMAVRREDETNPVVIWTAEASFVDAALLTASNGWIRVDHDLTEPTRSDVEAAVGPSLAGYVFADHVAPGPVAVARSVLAVASDITESESSPGEVTVSVKIDGSAGELEGLDGGPVPSLRFRLVDGRIAAIGARLPAGEEESFGFVWEYSASADVPEVAPPLVATEVADVAALVGSGDRRPPDCAMTP